MVRRVRIVGSWLALCAIASGCSFMGRAERAPRSDAGARPLAPGELRFTPGEPLADQAVTVEYRPDGLLADHVELTLRGRLRTAGDWLRPGGREPVRIGALVRGLDGVHRGRFRLPGSVVYAIFVVENASASVVDHNQGRGWELLVHTARGKPTRDALVVRTEELTGRDWEMAWKTARTLAELYPEHPDSWSRLWFFESAVFGAAGRAGARERHAERFRSLSAQSGVRNQTSGDFAGAMMFYAWALKDSIAGAHWAQRLEREFPIHPLAVQNRVIALRGRYHAAPDTLLHMLESLWHEEGPAHDQLGTAGFSAAQRVGDADAIRRWADRYLLFRPDEAGWIAARMAEHDVLREDAQQRLRDWIRSLESVQTRDLFLSVSAQREQNRTGIGYALAALGRALVNAGRFEAGLDTLTRAAAQGWDTNLLREVADAQLVVGDTAGALWTWARIAADPATPARFLNTVRRRSGRHMVPEQWSAALARARGQLRDHVLSGAVDDPLPVRVRVLDGSGAPKELADLLSDRTTVIAFWSRFCYPSLQQLSELQELSGLLEREDVRVLAITEEVPSSALTEFQQLRGFTVPVLHDVHNDAARAFQAWGTPVYYVVDGNGRVRFRRTTLTEIPRQVMALRTLLPG